MATQNSREEQQRPAGSSGNEEGVFNERPPAGTVHPPYFPNRPDLYNEVEWGNLPTQEDAQKAYTLWSTQDSCLEDENIRFRSRPQVQNTDSLNEPHACLARNVYENILSSDLLPLKPAKAYAQYRYILQTDTYKPWRHGEIFHPDNPGCESADEPPSSPILINGHNVLTDRFWTKVRLQAHLRSRHLDPNGLVVDLRQRLHDYEQEVKAAAAVDKESLLPREDLSDWGISRKNDFMIRISSQAELKPLDIYTWAIILSPYNPAYWTSRAYLHYQMGYFDLATGDAYRAQMLCEILGNSSTRNRQPGLYIRIWDAIEKHILQIPTTNDNSAAAVKLLRGSNGVNGFIPTVRKAIHHIISLSLLRLHCWSDYEAVEGHLTERLVMADRDTKAIMDRRDSVKPLIEAKQQYQRKDVDEYFYESNYGHVVLRDYPYSAQDVDRTAEEFTKRITKDFIGRSQLVNRTPKIAVYGDEKGDLSVYATQDIEVGEIVYIDEPSIRGHLHNATRDEQTEHRCENCKRKIRKGMPGLAKHRWVPTVKTFSRAVCDCSSLSSEPLYWCLPPSHEDGSGSKVGQAGPSSSTIACRVTRSQTAALQTQRGVPEIGLGREPSEKKPRAETTSPDPELCEPATKKLRSCLEIARSLYHHRACGKDWKWLHDSMRPNIASGRHEYLSHTHESHGTLLSLLLREVFDITLDRRKVNNRPNLLAHEIDELMPLCAGKDNDIFPFSFSANIRVPFDILMCLGVDIFRDLTFDTWVIQSVLRKLVPNVIAWDSHRRGLDLPEKEKIKHSRRRMNGTLGHNRSEDLGPTFRDLYIFPGMAMFNHFCPSISNVTWDWDSVIPNRIILWANKAIFRDDELVLPYTSRQLSRRNAYRLFQTRCNCPLCNETYGERSDDYTPFSDDHDTTAPPSSPGTLSDSASAHPGFLASSRNDHLSGQNPDNGSGSGERSDQGAMGQPENPQRQINADENYDESTGSDYTEIPSKPVRLSPEEHTYPRVKWAGEEVSPKTYRRKEGEREREQERELRY
ncbi:hypothetical protein EMCG_08600 [[Emmonsia] crescens]|uniref:SET domain-containing protein n=1 Tax=[Emmonsia] crescens TaxID=73230 RepID=A0A0G2I5R1_9EURO|nr:hypothetical protein EMCG_08600 [Emmonsia crescens UAMH 3008]